MHARLLTAELSGPERGVKRLVEWVRLQRVVRLGLLFLYRWSSFEVWERDSLLP